MQRTLGDYIKEKREAGGLNQTELSRRSGVPRETINRIENNKTMLPSADSRRRLAKALGVSHLDMLVAAGEILPEEVAQAGAVGVIESNPDDPTDDIIAMVRAVNWQANEEWAEGLKALMGKLRSDQTKP